VSILLHKRLMSWVLRLIAVVMFGAMAIVASLQFWILPNIDQWRDLLSASISRSAGQKVVLGPLQAGWNGWHPSARIQSITVYNTLNQPVLTLSDIQGDLAWSSLLTGKPTLAHLVLKQQRIDLHRDRQGTVWLSGIALNHPGGQHDFADWLAHQYQLSLQQATLIWQDDTRPTAPALVVKDLNLDIHNWGSHHWFHVSATPPALLAHPVDASGSVTTRHLADFTSWKGNLSINLQGSDLSQWQPWLTLPLGIQRGYGNLGLTLQFASGQLIHVTANALLSQLSMQTSPEQPRIELLALSGLLEWKRMREAQSLQLKQFSLRSADLTYIAPLDFYVRLTPATPKKPAEGELIANNINLQTLAHLTRYLPLTDPQRAWLAHYQPTGSLHNINASWQGDFPHPAHYQLAGRFDHLGLASYNNQTGFSNISGSIDGSDSTGSLQINSQHTAFDLPDILFEPHVALNNLTAQIQWQKADNTYHIRLSQASLSNPDMSGTLFGTYAWQPGTPGVIDLHGMLLNGNGAATAHYMPLAVQQPAYDWLRENLLSGKADNVQFHLAGDLAHYPFHNDKNGQLSVRIMVNNASLRPAPEFPVIDHINGMVEFAGTRMHIHANTAQLYRAKLSNINADIPDLFSGINEKLVINGEAGGNAADFVNFANHSPVAKVLDGLTTHLQATGNMKLLLNLTLPFHDLNKPQIKGRLLFINDRTLASDVLPAMDNIAGTLNFTESSINADNIALRLFGRPAQLACQTGPNATLIDLHGKLPATDLAQWLPAPIARQFNGSTNWQAHIQLSHGKFSAIDLNSNLTGMSSNLPAPFNKPANQSIALHINAQPAGTGNLITASYDDVIHALLMTSAHNGKTRLERGTISFGSPAQLSAAPGLKINGQLDSIDTDSWLGMMDGGSQGIQQADVDLTTKQFVLLGQVFNQVHLQARTNGKNWQTQINGSGIQGSMVWNSASQVEPHGTLDAKFQLLALARTNAAPSVSDNQPQDIRQWPKLSMHVDDFRLNQRPLGQLDIHAHPANDAIQFDQIRLYHPDSTLDMSALWQPGSAPQTKAKIHLTVNNLDGFLTRFGEPDTIKRGKASLDGNAEWNSSPLAPSLATLNGQFTLQAENGQFLKVDPGAAKLLGVLSLQDLPKHMTLDFHDVFSQGFAFDNISATLQLNHGIIDSHDFAMQGPAATVDMTGQVNLNSQTQALRAVIRPKLSESVALASSLVGGPLVGLGVLAVQKLLSNPFGQVIEYTYGISGSWTAPQVTKLDHAHDN